MSDGLVEIGRIGRAHGVHGSVYVALTTDRHERMDAAARLFDGDSWLTVQSAKRQPRGTWLVQFTEVSSRADAEQLTGRVLHAAPVDDADALWVSDLIGCRVVGIDGADHGRCSAVLDNPAHDLLELDSGALVPVVFVVSCAAGVVTIDPPEGLFDDLTS